MSFYKGIIVLNEESLHTVCGTVKMLATGGTLRVQITALLPHAAKGEYYAALADCNGRVQDFPLGAGGRVNLTVDAADDFQYATGMNCGIAEVDSGKYRLCAVGGVRGGRAYAPLFQEYFTTRSYYLEEKSGLPKNIQILEILQDVSDKAEDELMREDSTMADLAEAERQVVGCENYYDENYGRTLALRKAKRMYPFFDSTRATYDEVRLKNRLAGTENHVNVQSEPPLSSEIYAESEVKSAKEAPRDSVQPPEESSGEFYDSVAAQLNKIFADYGKEEYLESLITDSKWALVPYGGENFYTVGIIYHHEKPTYICYGVPGEYSEIPPKELAGYCEWLPRDMEHPHTKGYWMMYQDADTGKSISMDFRP